MFSRRCLLQLTLFILLQSVNARISRTDSLADQVNKSTSASRWHDPLRWFFSRPHVLWSISCSLAYYFIMLRLRWLAKQVTLPMAHSMLQDDKKWIEKTVHVWQFIALSMAVLLIGALCFLLYIRCFRIETRKRLRRATTSFTDRDWRSLATTGRRTRTIRG